jgi:hypothetical protein
MEHEIYRFSYWKLVAAAACCTVHFPLGITCVTLTEMKLRQDTIKGIFVEHLKITSQEGSCKVFIILHSQSSVKQCSRLYEKTTQLEKKERMGII